MRTKKSTAFWASFWILIVLYFSTLFIYREAILSIGGVIVGAIAAAGGLYQATNVADNAAKGAFYREELNKERDDVSRNSDAHG